MYLSLVRARVASCKTVVATVAGLGHASSSSSMHVLASGEWPVRQSIAARFERPLAGFRRFANYRIRALLYAGQANWHLL